MLYRAEKEAITTTTTITITILTIIILLLSLQAKCSSWEGDGGGGGSACMVNINSAKDQQLHYVGWCGWANSMRLPLCKTLQCKYIMCTYRYRTSRWLRVSNIEWKTVKSWLHSTELVIPCCYLFMDNVILNALEPGYDIVNVCVLCMVRARLLYFFVIRHISLIST